MVIVCNGCFEEIFCETNNTASAVIVACPICNAKNKILPKQEVVSSKMEPTKPSILKRIKSWLSL